MSNFDHGHEYEDEFDLYSVALAAGMLDFAFWFIVNLRTHDVFLDITFWLRFGIGYVIFFVIMCFLERDSTG